jgi:hypothetical protein
VAFAISFFTSTGGVSGAFLLLPFQVSILGFTSPAVSATNQLYNIVAIPSGVYRYVREGRMVWPLTWIVIAATLPGVLAGAWLRVNYLPDPRNFKLFAGLVLLYLGTRMLPDLLRRRASDAASAEARFQALVAEHKARQDGSALRLPRVRVQAFSLGKIRYSFYGETFEFSTPGVFLLSLAVGLVGGVYGIGGGAILAPFFVAIYRLPVYTVAGAALLGTFITSVAGVAFYQWLGLLHPDMVIAPDYLLGLLFGLGGAAGMYCGARLQKHAPAKAIKWLLVGVLLFTAITYVVQFFSR